MWDWFLHLDGEILFWIQELRLPFVTGIMRLISFVGEHGELWLLLAAFFLLGRKTREMGLKGFLSLGLTFLIVNLILKNAIARVRPYEVLDGLTCLAITPEDFSFPSGHSASAFAAAVVFYKKWEYKHRWIFLFLAGLMAFSRLYLGVHYPSDVICGSLIGILLALIVCRLKIFTPKKEKEG